MTAFLADSPPPQQWSCWDRPRPHPTPTGRGEEAQTYEVKTEVKTDYDLDNNFSNNANNTNSQVTPITSTKVLNWVVEY